MEQKENKTEYLSEEEKDRLIHLSEISLSLDTYDDIFSDFDPRNYSSRALSQDFLEEARRASRDKVYDGLELKLLIPVSKRNNDHEQLIKKRLHTHFKKHEELLAGEVRSIIRRGIIFAAIGTMIMLAAAFVLYKNHGGLLQSFLIILLEPAGWFFFWQGLDLIIFESKKKRPEREFYEKMAKCDVKFVNY